MVAFQFTVLTNNTGLGSMGSVLGVSSGVPYWRELKFRTWWHSWEVTCVGRKYMSGKSQHISRGSESSSSFCSWFHCAPSMNKPNVCTPLWVLAKPWEGREGVCGSPAMVCPSVEAMTLSRAPCLDAVFLVWHPKFQGECLILCPLWSTCIMMTLVDKYF
jgi:hypothetical protein